MNDYPMNTTIATSANTSLLADIMTAKSVRVRTMLIILLMILLQGIQFRVQLTGGILTEWIFTATLLLNTLRTHYFETWQRLFRRKDTRKNLF